MAATLVGPDVEPRRVAATVYDHDIRTEPFTWHGTRGAGFVGTVTFGLPRTAPPTVRRLFDRLGAFAAVAGIGHGTTHGLGVVEIADRAMPGS